MAGGRWGPGDVTACESAAVSKVRVEVCKCTHLRHICTCFHICVFQLCTSFNLMFMQAENLLNDMNQTISDGLQILDVDRVKVKKISVNLRDALNQSSKRSVLPTDLETAANFVDIVAK